MIGRMCRRWHGGATKLKCIATIPPAEVNDVSESTNSKMERRTSDEQPSLWPAVEHFGRPRPAAGLYNFRSASSACYVRTMCAPLFRFFALSSTFLSYTIIFDF